MLTGSYRKRLDADLVRWVGDGLVSAESAASIRRSLAAQAGFRLPALLGMFGGLLIAASLAAFVAANWEAIPRLVKLGLVLASVVIALGIAARLDAKGSGGGSDAAATCAVLIFSSGIALTGQMYHLPADWPGGALLVALGALIVAFLLRSNGALAIGFVAMTLWGCGRWVGSSDGLEPAFPPLGFLALWLPALWLALGRGNRFVHHAAVLSLAAWLALVPGHWLAGRFDYGLVAYGIAVSTVFVVIGAAALDRGGPALLSAFLPWGLIGLMVGLDVELIRILDTRESRAGSGGLMIYLAYAAALPAVLLLALRARDHRFVWPLAGALLIGLVVPVVFWSGGVVWLPGKVVVASLILAIAVGLVASGAAGGVRRLLLAGSGLFGIAILILLWRTIGTLLDQSLFFLVAGGVLLALASLARRLWARFGKPEMEPG